MGKKGGSSWFTAVKRAFRSPTKEANHDKARNCRRKEDHNQNQNPPSSEDQDDDKKKEKRRWLFKKATTTQQGAAVKSPALGNAADMVDERHAIAVAVATAATAEAAVATAQAAMEVAKLTRQAPTHTDTYPREHHAAIVIQTAFRGYLARRALRALRGLVKLQALVRGHNVRKQAKMTLKCMQALVRVQAQVLDQRLRLSHESCRKSAFSDTASMLDSRYLHDISERRSISHSGELSSGAKDWDERPHTIEEVKAMLQTRKEAAALRRERNLSQAVSHQVWRSDRSSVGAEEEMEEKPRLWLDRWMEAKQWHSSSSPALRGRASTDHRDSFKTVEVDTFRRSSTSAAHQQRPFSPLHGRAHRQQPPTLATPSPTRVKPIQARSASPRCIGEDRSYSSNVSQTPSLRSNYSYTPSNRGAAVPNYMAATESTKARIRSQSAPRQRPSTPERDRAGSGVGPKKRLSFPNPDPCSGMDYGGYSVRSPSFKSMMEQQSIYSSCCMDSIEGEISPSSTTDLRRWIR